MSGMDKLIDNDLLRIENGIDLEEYNGSVLVIPIKPYVPALRQPHRHVPAETVVRMIELQNPGEELGMIYGPIVQPVPMYEEGICTVPRIRMYGLTEKNMVLCTPSFEGLIPVEAPVIAELARNLKAEIFMIDSYILDNQEPDCRGTYYISDSRKDFLERAGIEPMPARILSEFGGDASVMLQCAAKKGIDSVYAVYGGVDKESNFPRPEIGNYMDNTCRMAEKIWDLLGIEPISDEINSVICSEIEKYQINRASGFEKNHRISPPAEREIKEAPRIESDTMYA